MESSCRPPTSSTKRRSRPGLSVVDGPRSEDAGAVEKASGRRGGVRGRAACPRRLPPRQDGARQGATPPADRSGSPCRPPLRLVPRVLSFLPDRAQPEWHPAAAPAGTLLVLLTLAYALATQRWAALVLPPGLWLRVRVGGALLRGALNRPATFSSPARTAWPATFRCSPTWRGAGSCSQPATPGARGSAARRGCAKSLALRVALGAIHARKLSPP